MKKIILVLTIMLSVILLGACASSDDTTELENRLELLELQVSEIEQILIDLQFIEGLNGEREYYLPDNYTIQNTIYQGVSATEYETLGSELDKSKAPSYVLDINGDYIPFIDLANMLVDKYYGTNVVINTASIGIQTELVIEPNSLTQDEFIARTILLVEELSNYDFYIIGSSQLVRQTFYEGTSRITIPIQTLRSSFITMTPEIIINGTYEIRKTGLTYNSENIILLYNEYVASELYSGYVLDFN